MSMKILSPLNRKGPREAALAQGRSVIKHGLSAIEQGKAALAQGRSAATDAVTATNRRLESAVESINVSDLVAPAYVWVGAADLVTEAISEQVEALPGEAAATVSRLRKVGKSRASKAQVDSLTSLIELRERFETSVENARKLRSSRSQAQLRGAAKEAAAAYIAAARQLCETLSARGESRVAEVLELARDPRLVRLVEDVRSVAPVGKKAPAKKVPAKKVPAKKVPAADAPAKKAPAKKVPARKAPAKKVPAADAPAKKAPAKKVPAKKAPAKKVPAEAV
jgi:hypothetical protein